LVLGVKCLRKGEQLFVERDQRAMRDSRAQHRIVGFLGNLFVSQVVELRGEMLLHALVGFGDAAVRGLGHGVDLVGPDQSVGDQLRREQLAHRRVLADLQIHERLRVRRLVRLVVTEAPVPDQVHHHVAVVHAAVVVRKGDRGDARLDVVRVDVDDRDVEALGEIRRIPCRPALLRVGCEPHLVVGDKVHRPAGGIPRQRLEVEDLLDDALSR